MKQDHLLAKEEATPQLCLPAQVAVCAVLP